MNIEVNGKTLSNLAKINVLVGKNGSGKSTLLRLLDEQKLNLPEIGIAKYITPERGGVLSYLGHIETQLTETPTWGADVRRSNRYDNFRQLSVTEFRRLEINVLRKIEKDEKTRKNLQFTFDNILSSINALLDHVQLVRGANVAFEIASKKTGEVRNPGTLSSGEAELVSIGIEVLSFAYEAETYAGKNSYLFMDEPDVHLHPDLQERLIKLIVETVKERRITVIIATHSTAILGALTATASHVGFLKSNQNEIAFSNISEALRNILPVFGAHPLSSVFNKSPILLVEGEDDERIWQQAVRSANGHLSIWPCRAGDIQSLDRHEKAVEAIASSIYENPRAFSLRDRDDNPYPIDDLTIVKRMRLSCRSAENLIVSDDTLASLNTNWNTLRIQIDLWLQNFPNHAQAADMRAFKDSGYDRKNAKIKSLRNVLLMLTGSQKPWEIAVGQAIAKLITQGSINSTQSLTNYLGPELVNNLRLFRRA